MRKRAVKVKQWAACDLLAMLRAKYSADDGWAVFTEVEAHNDKRRGYSVDRIDALVVGMWASRKESMAFEIKATRADWLNEIEDHAKNDGARDVATEFWYLCAPGIAEKSEVPEGCGLLVARPWKDDWQLRRVLAAKRRPKNKLQRTQWMRLINRQQTEIDHLKADAEQFATLKGEPVSLDKLRAMVSAVSARQRIIWQKQCDYDWRRDRRRDAIQYVAQWREVLYLMGVWKKRRWGGPPSVPPSVDDLRAAIGKIDQREQRDVADLLQMLAEMVRRGEVKVEDPDQ